MQPPGFIVCVPEPCLEDWNKMLPDEKGKSCLSCNKSVFDFSTKTDTEIKTILLEHKDQKICGHFKKSQVDRPLNFKVDLNDLPRNMSITKFFGVALFIVFGNFLFSCTDQKNEVVDGQIEVIENNKKNENNNELTTAGAPVITVEPVKREPQIAFELTPEEYMEYSVSGGVSYMEYAVPNSEIPQKDSAICNEEYADGGIKITNEEDRTKDDSLQPLVDPVYLGGAVVIMVEPAENEEPLKVDTLPAETVYKVSHGIPAKPITLSVFPNPGTGEFIIRYDVKKRADVRVDILDIKGSIVKKVVNVNGQYEGKYNIPVDLGELPSGIYFVKLNNNGENFTEKVILTK